MGKIKNAYSDDYILGNKNLRNNQNYVIDRELKDKFIIDRLSRYKSYFFLKICIYFFGKKLNTIKSKYISIIIISISNLFVFLCLGILMSGFINGALLLFFIGVAYISTMQSVSKVFINYFNTRLYVLGFRLNFSYEKTLIYDIKIGDSKKNNKLLNFSFFNSLLFTTLLLLILFFVL